MKTPTVKTLQYVDGFRVAGYNEAFLSDIMKRAAIVTELRGGRNIARADFDAAIDRKSVV